jgi:hypothetical protein
MWSGKSELRWQLQAVGNPNSNRLGKIRFIACKTTGYFNEPSKISRHIGRNIHAMRLAWQRLL